MAAEKKEVKQWVTVNGRHIPIYEKKEIQIAESNAKAKEFDSQKKIENLILEAKKFHYTHQALGQMWSRAQLFPVINQSVSLINKIQKQLSKMDHNNPQYQTLYAELQQLKIQHDLIEQHRDRLTSEIDGKKVYMNDNFFKEKYGPYGLYDSGK